VSFLPQLINPTNILLLVDAIFLLYLGFKDLKELEFSVYYLPLSLVIPILIYYWNYSVLLLIFTLIIGALFIFFLWLGMMGYMDVALVLRIPLVLMIAQQNAYSIAGFAIGICVAYLLYIHRYIMPVLCDRHTTIFSTKLKVRREALHLKYIYPVGVHVEDKNIEEEKKKILESTTDECIDAIAGVPLIFVFSAGYALAFTISLL